jgi:hypothetical protein
VKIHEKSASADTVAGAKCPGYLNSRVQEDYSPQQKLYLDEVGLNPLNAGLNPICHLLALLGAHPILHVSRIRVKFR